MLVERGAEEDDENENETSCVACGCVCSACACDVSVDEEGVCLSSGDGENEGGICAAVRGWRSG